MELCENGDLKQLIDKHKRTREPIKEETIWKVLAQMSLALKACHYHSDRTIIHRDIKPGNIFLDKYDNVKLGDFGLSKQLSESVYCATTNVGTPYYMSPEQVGGNKYDEKCDIWALGCIIHEMASLKVPFQAENYLRLADVITNSTKAALPDKYSKELHEMVDLLMNKDPKKRPNSKQLLQHHVISEMNSKATQKKRIILDKREIELAHRERNLLRERQIFKRQYEEFKQMKQNFEKEKKQFEDLRKNLNNRNTRNNMVEYNTELNLRQREKYDMQRLNRTTDQGHDVSSMYSSQEKKIEASVRHHNNKNGATIHSDDKENVNQSNSNLMSSNSSLNRNNYTHISSQNTKNMSGSGNFEDSSNDLSYNKAKYQKHYKEYPSKKININLYSEGNSMEASGSRDNRSNEKHSNVIQSRVTGNTSCTMASKANNALSKHLANKSIERSFETSKPHNVSINTSRGLPPSGQNFVQRSIQIDKSNGGGSLTKKSQEFSMNVFKRNFSTNNIVTQEESSRNRLGNRKSIPATYRGDEDFGRFQAPESTMQIVSSRKMNEEEKINSSKNMTLNNTQPFLKKSESDNTHKPPVQDVQKNFKLKNFLHKKNTTFIKE